MTFKRFRCKWEEFKCNEPPSIHGYCCEHYKKKYGKQCKIPKKYMNISFWAALLPYNNT